MGLMVPRGLGAGHGVAGAQMSAWCPDTLPESMTMSRAASLPALNCQGPSPCSESGVMSGSWPGARVAKNSATRCRGWLLTSSSRSSSSHSTWVAIFGLSAVSGWRRARFGGGRENARNWAKNSRAQGAHPPRSAASVLYNQCGDIGGKHVTPRARATPDIWTRRGKPSAEPARRESSATRQVAARPLASMARTASECAWIGVTSIACQHSSAQRLTRSHLTYASCPSPSPSLPTTTCALSCRPMATYGRRLAPSTCAS